MFNVLRAGRIAQRAMLTRTALRNSSHRHGPQPITPALKYIGLGTVGLAAFWVVNDGLGHSKRHPLEPVDEDEVATAVSHTPIQISAGVVSVGDYNIQNTTIEKPTYENLDIETTADHIIMKWTQDGMDIYQIANMKGEVLALGPLAADKNDTPAPETTIAAAVDAAVDAAVNDDAEPPKTEEEVIVVVADAASPPAPADATEQQADKSCGDKKCSGKKKCLKKLVREISDRLDKIEAALAHQSGPASLDGFPNFGDSCHSLLKKHLSHDVYLACANRMTPAGFTFENVLQSGVDNQDSGVGCYAGDEESYTVFAPLFDRVIEDYHNGYKPTDKHVSDMDADKLTGALDANYVISTRIRVGRNISGLGLSPGISRAQRRTVEKVVTDALNEMEGDLEGKYYSLSNMSEEDRKALVADHFLFKKGDRFLQSAGANRDWPESRGIFHNNEKTFLVWVNEEDQMRIISMEKGGDAKGIFERLSRGISAIESNINKAGFNYAYNDHLGYIHSCPTNCGTGMRASVHVKLPNVSKHPEFKQWCAKLRLQPRGIHGEHSESVGGVYDISNKERLGKSEVELVQTMIDGVDVLIRAEKALAAGNDAQIPSVLKN